MNEEKRDERANRGEEGRVAFHTMMKGFHDVSLLTQQLVGVNVAVAGKLDALIAQLVVVADQQGELIRQNGEVVAAQKLTCEHMATLQQQIGVLVQVLARQGGLQVQQQYQPPVLPGLPYPQPQRPTHADPIGAFGNTLVNGVLDHMRRGQPRGRGASPGH